MLPYIAFSGTIVIVATDTLKENTMEPDEKYEFLVSDYYATGEGQTISVLITRAYPHHDDYEEDSKNKSYTTEDGNFHFVMPTLKEGVTSMTIATREFVDLFGSYIALHAEFLSRSEFLTKWGKFLPNHIRIFLTEKDMDDAGNFKYYSQYHINYS
jgi:hypothetical protein